MQRYSSKTWSKKLGACTLYTLYLVSISLVGTELLLRLFLPGPYFEQIRVSTKDDMEYQLVANPDLIYIPVPNTGPLNTFGHRGLELSAEIQSDRNRVIFLGDSVVEGWGVEEEERFTSLLADRLQAYEIANFGVRGYNLYQYLEYLKFRILSFEFDHLIVGISFNDLALDSGEITAFVDKLKRAESDHFYALYYGFRRSLLDMLLDFHLGRHLVYLSNHSPKHFAKNDNFYREASGRHEKKRVRLMTVFEEFKSLARLHNFSLSVVLLPPHPENRHVESLDVIRKTLTETDIRTLDIATFFEQTIDPELRASYFIDGRDPCHLSPLGMQKLFELLAPSFQYLTHESPVPELQ